MIFSEGEDKDGKYYSAGLIQRYALTLENYAGSDWGNRFYSAEFLSGFCERRNEIHAQTGKSAASLFSITTLLAFFQNVAGEITFWGISFSVPELGALALAVLVSINFFVAVGHFLDQLIMDAFLNTLGNRIGAYSFEIALLDMTAKNLWTSAITPNYYGLASGAKQRYLTSIFSLLFFVLVIAAMLFPIGVVYYTIFARLSNDPSALEYVLSAVSIFGFFLSFFAILIFSMNYRFRPSGMSEPADPFIPENFMEMGHPNTQPLKDGDQTDKSEA